MEGGDKIVWTILGVWASHQRAEGFYSGMKKKQSDREADGKEMRKVGMSNSAPKEPSNIRGQ